MLLDGSSTITEEDALLEWANTFALTRPVNNLTELGDGQALWEMLRDIDELWFTEQLPNNDLDEEAKRANIRFICQHVEQNLDANGQKYENLDGNGLDRSIATGSVPDICMLMRAILLVMLGSSKLAELLSRIQGLPAPAMQLIGGLMQEVSGWNAESDLHDEDSSNSNLGSQIGGEASKPMALLDPRAEVLQLEAQYATVISQLERRNRDYDSLDTEHQTLSDSFTRLQDTNDALTEQVLERDDQLKRLRNLETQREQSSVRELELQISQQEETIASRELELTRSQTAFNELKRENKRLLGLAERFEKVQDDYDATKVELEKQSRKANTADKYMQKLQASHAIEKERDSLRLDLDDARKQLSHSEGLRRDNKALQKTNEEVSQTLAQIEREDEELRMTYKKLRISCDSYEQQIGWLNERSAQDQETITELRDLQEKRVSVTERDGTAALDNELMDSNQRANSEQTRVETLEMEKDKLIFEKTEEQASIVALQERLARAEASRTDYHNQLQKYRQENLTLQTSLAQVQGGHPIEGTKVFRRLRDQLRSAEEQKAKLQEELRFSKYGQHDLDENDSPSTANQPKPLGEIGAQLSAETLRLLDELEQLKLRNETLQKDRDDLTKDLHQKGRNSLANGFTEHELRALLAVTSTQYSTVLGNTIISAIHAARVSNASAEDLESHDTLRETLLEILRKTTDGRKTPPAAVSKDSRTYIQNLERENRLMASRFHDLAGRLQLNNVILQRKSDAPNSWLSRQRKAFDGPIGLAR